MLSFPYDKGPWPKPNQLFEQVGETKLSHEHPEHIEHIEYSNLMSSVERRELEQ